MSGGGNVEGYLLQIDGEEARIVYCILDEGILQYFTMMGGQLLGVIPLTGCKVDVFLVPNEEEKLPFQFKVQTQAKNVRKLNSAVPTQAQVEAMNHQRTTSTITLAGATQELTDKWALSVLNWNRYSWEDPQTLCSSKDEYETLKAILIHSKMKIKQDPQPPNSFLQTNRAIIPL